MIGLLHQYLKMLRKIGPQEWVFLELKAMAMMEFKFAEEESADNYTVRLASRAVILNVLFSYSVVVCSTIWCPFFGILCSIFSSIW